MCFTTPRLNMTPFLRHCETSHGRYIAVLMQTEVNEVPPSMPSGNSSLLRTLNCTSDYQWVLEQTEITSLTYVGHNLAEPCVFANQFSEPLTDRTLVLFPSINERVYTCSLTTFLSASFVLWHTLKVYARFRVVLGKFC